MADIQGIRSKIASVKNTRKITKAMEMVAASKMRRTQDRMSASKPYAEKIYSVIQHLADARSEYRHPFLQTRDIQRIGIVIVTTDRGLCGGLNINLLRDALQQIRQWQHEGKDVVLSLVGKKAGAFFKRVGGRVISAVEQLGDHPGVAALQGIVDTMVEAYVSQQIDALYIIHNDFVSTMTQTPHIKQLLPLPPAEKPETEAPRHQWDYIYEPDAKRLLDALLERYIEVQIYQAVIENIACEQAAKMIAMKNATDNASELIKQFQLAYNKARQAAITQELAEIVAGAAAL